MEKLNNRGADMKKLYVYYEEQFEQYRDEKEKQGIKILSVSKISKIQEDTRLLNGEIELDLTTLGMALQNRGDLAFNLETVFDTIPDEVKFIVSDEFKDVIKKAFKFDFSEFVHLYDIKEEQLRKRHKNKKIMICNLDNNRINQLLKQFNNKIYGHIRFKEDFRKRITSYKVLNKLGEQKVLSIFIMGESGTGKTEVANCLYKLLGGKLNLCKISFANYSSKDSLNSLIGSPRGYIGSEDGELVRKIKNTDVGLILIDEFEKADEKVHNFFLELLEKGSFSDSQGNDYNMNGYIIIFTSNMSQDRFKKEVLPELISRFDYICQFSQLRKEDKEAFVKDYIEELIKKYEKTCKKKVNINITGKIKETINIDTCTNIRNLKKDIAYKFIELIEDEV